MAKSGKKQGTAAVSVHLTQRELESLVRVAHHYEKTLGAMRHVVLITTSADMRARYRFVRQEGNVLQQLARTTLESMRDMGEEQRAVALQPAAVIAFWGRVVSSIMSSRSRKKLSAEEIHVREALASKLQSAAAELRHTHPRQLVEAMETRKPAEAEWMLSALQSGEPDPVLATR